MTKVNGIYCMEKIPEELAVGLRSSGIEYVVCNFDLNSKKEADMLIKAGLKIVSIYESDAGYAGYFNEVRGIANGEKARSYAEYMGLPEGSAIYFPVYFDAQPSDMRSVLSYFHSVREGLGKSYKLGVYGSYSVLEMLYSFCAADYFWQTVGWPFGNEPAFINILQSGFKHTIEEISVDFLCFSNSAGSWGNGSLPESSIGGSMPPSNLIYAGEVLNIPSGRKTGLTGRIEYTVSPGETLSQIAEAFGTTVIELQIMNSIIHPEKIKAGERIWVENL
jgi:hypothetical protein